MDPYIILIGCWAPLWHNYDMETLRNHIGSYLGFYNELPGHVKLPVGP